MKKLLLACGIFSLLLSFVSSSYTLTPEDSATANLIVEKLTVLSQKHDEKTTELITRKSVSVLEQLKDSAKTDKQKSILEEVIKKLNILSRWRKLKKKWTVDLQVSEWSVYMRSDTIVDIAFMVTNTSPTPATFKSITYAFTDITQQQLSNYASEMSIEGCWISISKSENIYDTRNFEGKGSCQIIISLRLKQPYDQLFGTARTWWVTVTLLPQETDSNSTNNSVTMYPQDLIESDGIISNGKIEKISSRVAKLTVTLTNVWDTSIMINGETLRFPSFEDDGTIHYTEGHSGCPSWFRDWVAPPSEWLTPGSSCTFSVRIHLPKPFYRMFDKEFAPFAVFALVVWNDSEWAITNYQFIYPSQKDLEATGADDFVDLAIIGGSIQKTQTKQAKAIVSIYNNSDTPQSLDGYSFQFPTNIDIASSVATLCWAPRETVVLEPYQSCELEVTMALSASYAEMFDTTGSPFRFTIEDDADQQPLNNTIDLYPTEPEVNADIVLVQGTIKKVTDTTMIATVTVENQWWVDATLSRFDIYFPSYENNENGTIKKVTGCDILYTETDGFATLPVIKPSQACELTLEIQVINGIGRGEDRYGLFQIWIDQVDVMSENNQITLIPQTNDENAGPEDEAWYDLRIEEASLSKKSEKKAIITLDIENDGNIAGEIIGFSVSLPGNATAKIKNISLCNEDRAASDSSITIPKKSTCRLTAELALSQSYDSMFKSNTSPITFTFEAGDTDQSNNLVYLRPSEETLWPEIAVTNWKIVKTGEKKATVTMTVTNSTDNDWSLLWMSSYFSDNESLVDRVKTEWCGLYITEDRNERGTFKAKSSCVISIDLSFEVPFEKMFGDTGAWYLSIDVNLEQPEKNVENNAVKLFMPSTPKKNSRTR